MNTYVAFMAEWKMINSHNQYIQDWFAKQDVHQTEWCLHIVEKQYSLQEVHQLLYLLYMDT